MEETSLKPGEITEMLKECSGGNREALDKLVPYVYEELHRQAHRYLNHERQGSYFTNHRISSRGIFASYRSKIC